jgi:hypothetical protein
MRKCPSCGKNKKDAEFYNGNNPCKCCWIKRVSLWQKNNPKRLKEIRKAADAKKRSTPKGRMSDNMANSVRRALKGNKKGRCWENLAGYTIEQLRVHLEKQFKDGMSWDNYGEWHIDHIIPKAVFNYEKPEDDDFKRCWALSNLQPLWGKENVRKKSKINKHFQPRMIFK